MQSKTKAPKRTTKQKSGKAASATIPRQIKLRREAGYHTHYIGTCKNGDQFMAFIVGAQPSGSVSGEGKLTWYAVLHRFNADGGHLGTEASFLAKAALGRELDDAETRVEAMIHQLGPVTYRDIEVELFSINIDGYTFGLVDASVPKEGYQRVDLLPNNLAFFPPWNGDYDT